MVACSYNNVWGHFSAESVDDEVKPLQVEENDSGVISHLILVTQFTANVPLS